MRIILLLTLMVSGATNWFLLYNSNQMLEASVQQTARAIYATQDAVEAAHRWEALYNACSGTRGT